MPGHVIPNDLIVKTEEITAGSAKYFGVETSQPLLMADANVVKIDGVVKLRQGASPLRLRMELQGSNDLWQWFVVATFETQAASNPNLWLSTGSGTDLGESAPRATVLRDARRGRIVVRVCSRAVGAVRRDRFVGHQRVLSSHGQRGPWTQDGLRRGTMAPNCSEVGLGRALISTTDLIPERRTSS